MLYPQIHYTLATYGHNTSFYQNGVRVATCLLVVVEELDVEIGGMLSAVSAVSVVSAVSLGEGLTGFCHSWNKVLPDWVFFIITKREIALVKRPSKTLHSL